MKEPYTEDVSIIEYQKGNPVLIKRGSIEAINPVLLSNKSKDRVRLLLQ